MKLPMMLAAGLTALTAIAHVFGRISEFMDPILESNAPDFNKTGMTIIWHWVTAVLCMNAVVLFLAGRNSPNMAPSIWIVILQFLSFGVIFAVFGLTAFGSLFVMPQWIPFFLIPALAYYGLRANAKA